jgi:DNA-binding protein WhiA
LLNLDKAGQFGMLYVKIKQMATTFSKSVKNEIIKGMGGIMPCCELVALAAFVRTMGSVDLSPIGLGFSVSGENLSVIKFVAKIAEKLYGIKGSLKEEHVTGLKRTKYIFAVKNGEQILEDVGIVGRDEDGMRGICDGFDTYLLSEECCRRTFIKCVFLGAGYVTLPEKRNKDGYHLEFAFENEPFCKIVNDVLKSFSFAPKKVLRKNETVLYFKGSEEISDMLALLGASTSVFQLQNTILERLIRNNVNRQTNCISANIDKTVEAAERQLASIKSIEETIGLEKLPKMLQDAAKLRKRHPSGSLDELAISSADNVTKSGLNHRFRRIDDIAKNLK